jgi:hypothetical protein
MPGFHYFKPSFDSFPDVGDGFIIGFALRETARKGWSFIRSPYRTSMMKPATSIKSCQKSRFRIHAVEPTQPGREQKRGERGEMGGSCRECGVYLR